MSGPNPSREYYPGDEIKMALSFVSSSHISAVDVVYAHTEFPALTLTLSGNPEAEEGATGRNKRHGAVVSGVVDVGHVSGYYEIDRFDFYPFSGGLISENPDRPGVAISTRTLVIALETREIADLSLELHEGE
jgi:hypothetical protein